MTAESNNPKNKKISSLISFVLTVGVLAYFFSGSATKNIYDSTANDLEEQYHMVFRNNGSAIDLCVQAQIVAAGYLQAKNQEKYAVWKETERRDCEKSRASR